MASSFKTRAELFATLPPPWLTDLLPAIRAEVSAGGRQLVVIDDDPTGTQTVRDVMVVTRWDVETLESELALRSP